MRIIWIFPIFALFAGSAELLALLDNTTYPTLLPIDPARRGSDLIAMFARLQQAPYSQKSTYEIALRTQINGTKGFVPFINNIVAPVAPPPSPAQSSYDTLLLVWYRLKAGGDISLNKYIVLPIEQIVQMVYSTTTITGSVSDTYNIVDAKGSLPYYEVNPIQRAFDIRAAVYTLNNVRPYFKTGPWPNVSLTTTLRGNYNGNGLSNGVIPFVREVHLSGSMMVVTYQLTESNNVLQYIVVAPEQVISINYLRN